MATNESGSEEFELEEVHRIHTALRDLPPKIANMGRGLQVLGRVTNVAMLSVGTMYAGTVSPTAGDDYPVRAALEAGRGWVFSCSCPSHGKCEHGAALAWELLARHSGAVVNRLAQVSAAQRRPAESSGAAKKKKGGKNAAQESGGAEKGVKAYDVLLGRLHQQLTALGYLTTQDLVRAGMNAPSKTMVSRVSAWHRMPQSTAELRDYLALWMQENGWNAPAEWLDPAALERCREERNQFRREENLAKWRQRLQAVVVDEGASSGVRIELRLVLDSESAYVEWRKGEAGEFSRMRASHGKEVDRGMTDDLDEESSLLWLALEDKWGDGVRLELRYSDSEDVETLHHILKNPRLNQRVVSMDGAPVQRHLERLRWELETPERVAPAGDGAAQYRMQLTFPDGTPVTRIRFVTGGRPPLYFTEQGLYSGPRKVWNESLMEGAFTIPYYAVETPEGAHFLQAMGVTLPASLERRIDRRPVRLLIRGELAQEPFVKDREVCRLKILAESSDGGYRQEWRYGGWHDVRPIGRTPIKTSSGQEQVVWYDASAVPSGNALLTEFSADWVSSVSSWQIRVTRSFPEVFAQWLSRLPKDALVELRGELKSLLDPTVSGRVSLSVEETDLDWFDLKVVVNVSDAELTPEEVRLLLNAKGKWVRLGEKGWKRLAFELSDEENENLARLGLSASQFSAEPQRFHALQLADTAAKRFLKDEQYERIERRATELLARVTPEVPPIVKAQLRPYQLEGFHFLAYLASNRFGGVLADDMGLGKTLQTLTWLAWLRSKTSVESPGTAVPPILVVCPKSVAHNWRAECERFVEGMRVKVWESGAISDFKKGMGVADLHVMNYAQLRSAGEEIQQLKFLAVILDEGQYIKNASGVTNQLVCRMQAQHRLILSGTPIENRLADLWALMRFAMPGALGNRAEFGRVYDAKDDPFARRRLSARVRPFLLRRTKGQVARDLPDRIEEDSYTEMEGEQKSMYTAELKRAQGILLGLKTAKDLNKTRFHLLTSLLRLRQICCDARLLNPDLREPGAKLEALEELVTPLMEQGEKVLIFSQFVEMLQLIRKALEDKVPKVFYLAGDTEDRGELVDTFQSHSGAAVFLISLKAGGFGLNLTAASYVVLFDPWWNPAVENQAIDRTHRIGQSRKVIAYRLLIKGSIEEKIRALQSKKKALAEDVLGEEKFSQALTLDDLQYLFSEPGA